jgi:hypothetical protein
MPAAGAGQRISTHPASSQTRGRALRADHATKDSFHRILINLFPQPNADPTVNNGYNYVQPDIHLLLEVFKPAEEKCFVAIPVEPRSRNQDGTADITPWIEVPVLRTALIIEGSGPIRWHSMNNDRP